MDVVEFLNARLDEDEAAAKVAANVAGPDWTWKTGVTDDDEVTDYVTSPDGTVLLDTLGGIESEAPHVARHDPARVLRDVEAGRILLWAYKSSVRSVGEGLSHTLRGLVLWRAAVYSDHPDYRPEWKP